MQTERAKTKELADDRCLCLCLMQRNQFDKQKAIYDGCVTPHELLMAFLPEKFPW